jgi:Bacterial conjugation TrbI-like protein
MPDEVVVPKQQTQQIPYPEPEDAIPEQGADPAAAGAETVQPQKQGPRSMLGGVSAGGSKAMMIFAGVALVVIVVFMLISKMPSKPKATNRAKAVQQQQQQRGPVNQLPNGPVADQEQGLNPSADDLTPDAIQGTAKYAKLQNNGGTSVGSAPGQPEQQGHPGQQGKPGESGQESQNNGNLSQIQPFTPPPVPGAGGQWTPQQYNGSPIGGGPVIQGQSAAVAQQISNSRREALTKTSMTYVDQTPDKAQLVGTDSSSAQAALLEANRNFGYRPGYHLSAHLETVASTAIVMPVIAVVDFDYQRNGVTVIPAGSRVFGTMGASNSTGLTNLHFTEIRLPRSNTPVSVSAIGLDHQLMPIKGYVTGRHQVEQFLLAALAGLGSTAAVFAGNNVNGQLTEADLMKESAANSASNSVNQEIGNIQNTVSDNLVVTVPAGTQVEVMFIGQSGATPLSAAPGVRAVSATTTP